jgi:ribonuclease HII
MICGIDEAGRGPVMGPLVIAGVKLESDKDLIEMKVRDSKKCTVDRREKLAAKIKDIADIELIVIPANELDILRQALTLNKIEALLFKKIILKMKPEQVFVDCVDTDEESFKNNLMSNLTYDPQIISKHRADDIFPVVSAASIIAKTERDKEILRISDELGKDVGSGYPADPITIEFIKNWLVDHDEFPPHTRHSWKTTTRLWEDYKYRPMTLDDYSKVK